MKQLFSTDAFGVGSFDSEKALDNSQMIQRERKWLGDLLDFRGRETDEHKVVWLSDGPYHGMFAAVGERQSDAWVIGDFSYQRRADGHWHWWYDAMA